MLTPRSVLVVRLSSLGDVVLTTPVFAALRRRWPSARRTLLVKRAFAPALAGHPDIDETLVFEDRGFLGTLREIRRRRFDLLVDLHGTFRSRLWSAAGGAGRVVRYDKRAAARRRLVWFKRPSPALAGRTVDRYLEPLAALGVPVDDRTPRLVVAASERPSAERLGSPPWIAVAPGARHATKRWPGERFAAAADRLAEDFRALGRAPTVLILGAPSDAAAAEEVRRAVQSPVVDLVGRTTVRETMAVLQASAVLLSNDSGAAHLGAAVGAPTVAVFGPTVEAFGFFPTGPRTAVVEAAGLDCRPCSLHGGARCPRRHFRCMTDVSVDAVVERTRALLGPGGRA